MVKNWRERFRARNEMFALVSVSDTFVAAVLKFHFYFSLNCLSALLSHRRRHCRHRHCRSVLTLRQSNASCERIVLAITIDLAHAIFARFSSVRVVRRGFKTFSKIRRAVFVIVQNRSSNECDENNS